MTYGYRSEYMIGDHVRLGEIDAVVTSVQFEGACDNPNVMLKWFNCGDMKETWIREQTLMRMIAGEVSF